MEKILESQGILSVWKVGTMNQSHEVNFETDHITCNSLKQLLF